MVHPANDDSDIEDDSLVDDVFIKDEGMKNNDVTVTMNGNKLIESVDNVEENDVDEDDDDELPIDRGWAWVISIAAHMIQLLKVGYSRANGILFVEFLRKYQTSATVTTLMSGVLAGVFGFSVFISMQLLVGWIPIRYIIMLGGTISALGIIGSAFATNIAQLIILQGAMLGVGNSMMSGPAYVLISKYFKKKRGFGTNLANSGISSGSIIFPILVRFLLDEYGLQGTLMIVGALELNIVAFACLMRPLESFKRTNKHRIVLKDLSKCQDKVVKDGEPLLKEQFGAVVSEKSPQLGTNLLDVSHKSKSQVSLISALHSQSDLYRVKSEPDIISSQEAGVSDTRCNNPFRNLDFSVWKHPYFILLALTTFFSLISVLFLTYYPVLLIELGATKQDVATFLSIAGGIDFISRLGIGYFSDLGYMKKTHICVISLIITGINCHMCRFYTTYGLQLVGTIICGLFGGIYPSFMIILVPDLLGVDRMAKALGFILILIGIALSVYNPSLGALKDSTQSFAASFHFMGTVILLGAFLLSLEPLFGRCVKRADEEKQKDKISNSL